MAYLEEAVGKDYIIVIRTAGLEQGGIEKQINC